MSLLIFNFLIIVIKDFNKEDIGYKIKTIKKAFLLVKTNRKISIILSIFSFAKENILKL